MTHDAPRAALAATLALATYPRPPCQHMRPTRPAAKHTAQMVQPFPGLGREDGELNASTPA
jgi:hypothetical protein